MTDSPPLQALQVRAARALLGWSQTELAEKAGIARPTIALIERNKSEPYSTTQERIREAFVEAGVVFINDGIYVGATLKTA